MAIEILPQEEGLAEKLGRGLGTGLGSGLQQLAQSNLQNMLAQKERARRTKSYMDLGFTQQYAQALSDLPEKTVHDVLTRGLQVPGQQQGIAALQQEGAFQPTITQQPTTDAIRLGPSEQQLRHEQLLGLKKGKEERETAKDIRSWIAGYREKAQEAETLQSNYKTLKEAALSGDLKSGAWQRFAQSFGFSEFNTNNASQIFDKAAAEIRVHLAKVALPKGSKITNMIEQLVGKTVAERGMDLPAIAALAEAGELLMQLAPLEYKQADELSEQWEKEGKGIPARADIQIDKRTEKEKKDIRKKVQKILHRGIKGEMPEPEPTIVGNETVYSSADQLPQLTGRQGVWDVDLGRFLTDKELLEIGYGK